jgi:uncharacterized membrane protein (UPF0182 family)
MRFRSLPGLLVLALVLLFVVPSAVGFYTDWLWFRELRYEGIFLKTINAQSLVFASTFAVVFVFLYGNLLLARRPTADRPRIMLGSGPDGRPISLDGRQVSGLALPVSIGLALLLGLAGASHWLMWLSYIHATPFGQTDPLFGREIAFYVFRLPVYQAVRQQALVVTFLSLIGCLVYYVFSGSFVVESRAGVTAWPRIRLVSAARRHLSLLTALIFVLLAWGAWLEVPSLLLAANASAVPTGASYSDVYANIPFLRASMGVLIVGAILAIWHGFGRRGWPLPLAVALYLVVSMAGGVYASFVQRFVVTPNEQNMEREFILHNIDATRRAYALDRVQERELSGAAALTPDDIVNNAATIENVRLWDHSVLLQTFTQIQEIRPYYDFLNVDNDRYTIDGKPHRQVMLSVREINTETMPNRSWVNERLTFTHGYGLTLGPVNQVTTEGLPVLFVRDLPPISTVNLRVDEPSVYYGELSSNYAIVRTSQPEFHYPSGDNNTTTYYNGSGGVPVGSLSRRLLFATRFSSTDILVSKLITRDSRIMFHRKIEERLQTLAPFFTYDFDPYPVLSDGRLYWLQDAYTTTANYPYSTRTASKPNESADINYIRNAVKIVVDAYNGSVSFYLADPADPIAQTIARIFPGMLRPLSDMPADLRQHVRYPEQLFSIQARMYLTYHMTNPSVFYNKEDQWQVPRIEGGSNATPMQPYYTIMKLPDEPQAEFIQMLPFTPRARDNLSAWMVARSDGANYGKIVVLQFPKTQNVFGPRQIIGRIQQDPVITPQIALWSQQGSEVHWGTLLVIPIGESLIYVRPVYLRSPEGRIPELKRVVVAYQNRIVMADTLTQALVQIFGRGIASALAPDQLGSSATSVVETTESAAAAAPMGPPPGAVSNDTLQSLAAEAKLHADNADRAMRAGDWALFGDEWNKAIAAINRMQKTP